MIELIEELKKAYGEHAKFKGGQLKAIQKILAGNHLLVVQKTGWGKSLVYFLATKILRKRKKGITIIISPLLALINNQIDSAVKFGLNVQTINSTNKKDWDYIIQFLKMNKIDALIISPERLADSEFVELLIREITMKIILFVVDEAHCISDWGHDFRPDYRRIVDLIQCLPPNIPILATTATANNRVIKDIKEQLGESLSVIRGSLMRKSLAVQVIHLLAQEERLGWILENIHNLPGTGLIYCLTVSDCELVYKWLKSNEINCACYYSKMEQQKKDMIQKKFMKNEIKVLIATVAFGMGIDKTDISFVVHFQKPKNIVSYYQQIGRAGRGIHKALAILLVGQEDDEINQYFIDSAFPTIELMNEIINIIQLNEGIKRGQIESRVNASSKRIDSCIRYLLVNRDIYCEESKYYKTPKIWRPDLKHMKDITDIRLKELQQMNDFVNTKQCYMEFIAKKLDDLYVYPCRKCKNCLKKEIIPSSVSKEFIIKAQIFIKNNFNIIEPRKKWPFKVCIDGRNMIKESDRCQEGIVLSNYRDTGLGKLVSEEKYEKNCFSDELVEASCKLLKQFTKENKIYWITNIPSLRRPNLVKDFAIKVAKKLGLHYIDSIEKIKDVVCQKELNSSFLQYRNAFDSFEIKKDICIPKENVLLIDDIVSSKWTFTVCGYQLIQNGSGKVYPFALANSAGRNGED